VAALKDKRVRNMSRTGLSFRGTARLGQGSGRRKMEEGGMKKGFFSVMEG